MLHVAVFVFMGQNITNLTIVNGIAMDKLLPRKINIFFLLCSLGASSTYAFELLSEGAMGSVSAISANSAEEIVSIAGSTAAGLTVDDGYESLPFQSSVLIGVGDRDEVSNELDFVVTREVDAWSQNLQVGNTLTTESVGYVDVLPEGSFSDDDFVVPSLSSTTPTVFDPDSEGGEDGIVSEIDRVNRALRFKNSGVDTIEYRVYREIELATTIKNPAEAIPTLNLGYVTGVRGYTSVKVFEFRD